MADRTPARVRRIAPGARAADRTPDPRFQINPLINDYNGPACAYATGPFGPARGAGVREEVATTLARLRPAAALEGLLRSMEDEAWQVSLRAARALGRLGDRRAGATLCEALAHPAGNLRKEAAIALGEIGDPGAAPALAQAAQDPDPEVRKVARASLARLAGAPAT